MGGAGSIVCTSTAGDPPVEYSGSVPLTIAPDSEGPEVYLVSCEISPSAFSDSRQAIPNQGARFCPEVRAIRHSVLRREMHASASSSTIPPFHSLHEFARVWLLLCTRT